MACTFTREDLQEEFRRFSVEIRNLHQNLQQELHNDVKRMLSDRSWAGESPPRSASSWASSARRQSKDRKPTPAATKRSLKDGVAFSFGDSVSTEGGWRSTSSKTASADAFAMPQSVWSSKVEKDSDSDFEVRKFPGVVSDSEDSHDDGGCRVHPAPAESLRGSGLYIQDALRPPSCIPESGPPTKVLSEVHENVFNSGRPKTPEKEHELPESDPGSEPSSARVGRGSLRETMLSAIGEGSAWLPDTYKDKRGASHASGDSESTVVTSYSCEDNILTKSSSARHRWRHEAQTRDFDSGFWNEIKMGEVSKWQIFITFLSSEAFDYFMGVFLFANAISIGLQVEVMCKIRDEGSATVPIWLRIVDLAFCLIFLAELLTRIAIWRGAYLRMKGWQWNCFDILVVSFSVVDEISKQFLVGTAMQETIDSMGVLRMLRLARVVRLIRMVRLIPELKSMVYLILSSMWSFFWTLILLTLLIYVVAVYYTEVSTDLILTNENAETSTTPAPAASGGDDEIDPTKEIDVELLKTHYGSIFSSILSLFMAITGGDDWRNFVDLFKPDGSYILNISMFVVYISFVTLVMLNLVTGVFVEGAQRIVASDKQAEIRKNVQKLFHVTDTDKSGEISWEEFEAQLDTERMKNCLHDIDMNAGQAKGLFKLLDTDRSGELSVDEFVEGCLRLRVPARSVDLQTLKYDFEEITNHWAGQFALIGAQIANIVDLVEKMSWATVASLPEELILV